MSAASVRARPGGRAGRPGSMVDQGAHVGLAEPAAAARGAPSRRGRGPARSRARAWPGPRSVAGDGHDQQRRVAGVAQQVAEQQQRVVVGPLEVVEHGEHRPVAGGVDQQLGHRVEQLGPVGLGADAGAAASNEGNTRGQLGPGPVGPSCGQLVAGRAATKPSSSSTNGW